MNLKQKKIILAPMAGITDLPFRIVCKEMGADTVYSEMISAAGIYYNQGKTLDFLQTDKKEWPVVFQLFGSDPKHFSRAAKTIQDLLRKRFSQVKLEKNFSLDINFGCPVKKVIKQGAGCALMEKPRLAKEIIKATSENTSLPVSLKIRAGYKKTTALDFLENFRDLGWKSVMIHGRTFAQGFSGPINLELIKKTKQLFPGKKVIANGGAYGPETAKQILEETLADGIAFGQGAMGNPWIFKQTKNFLKTGKYEKPTLNDIKKIALKHANLMQKHKGKDTAIEMRKHLGWYFRNIPGAKKTRKALFSAKTFSEIREIISSI
jgi:tRNA-dihydrouridine synthase B